jgi:hypothetical protein
MNNTNGPNTSGPQDVPAWSILASVDRLGVPTLEGQYPNFEEAVKNLKSVRLDMYNGWVVAWGPETRDTYPYRNKIGELWQLEPLDFAKDRISWGYRWYDRVQNSVIRVWLEKTSIGSREAGETVDAPGPTDRQVQKMYEECEIEYVALGQPLPEKAWFDEGTRDFVWEVEEEDGSENGGRVEDGIEENDLAGGYGEEDGFGEEYPDEDGVGEDDRDEDDREDYSQGGYDGEYELRKSWD